MGPHFQPDILPLIRILPQNRAFHHRFCSPKKNGWNTWGISASPLKDDIMKWTAVMFGPAGNLSWEKVSFIQWRWLDGNLHDRCHQIFCLFFTKKIRACIYILYLWKHFKRCVKRHTRNTQICTNMLLQALKLQCWLSEQIVSWCFHGTTFNFHMHLVYRKYKIQIKSVYLGTTPPTQEAIATTRMTYSIHFLGVGILPKPSTNDSCGES